MQTRTIVFFASLIMLTGFLVSQTFSLSAVDRYANAPLTRQDLTETVAPSSGASISSLRKAMTELYRLRRPELTACLEPSGRSSLVAAVDEAATYDREGHYMLYPEQDRLLNYGFAGPAKPLSLELDTASRDPQAVRCQEETISSSVPGRLETEIFALRSKWAKVVYERYASAELLPATESFVSCLSRAPGVRDVKDEDSFFSWADSYRLENSETDPDGRTPAQIYLNCGNSLFEARAQALAQARPGFLALHVATIEALVVDFQEVEILPA